ncbi:MAG: acyltransferase [Bacteroidota bacterium]
MKELIQREILKIAAEKNLPNGHPVVQIALFVRLVSLGTNYLLSRWRLRRCTSLGKIVFTRKKPTILNQGELRIGSIVRIWSNVNRVRLAVGKGAVLYIGDNTRLNGPTISVSNKVWIGKNCRIAPHVIIMDSDFHDVTNRLATGKGGEIIIKDDAWVATRAMVLKGVTIGKGAVVAAGAVVTKDVPDYCVAAGIPAKVIKRLQPQEAQTAAAPLTA